MPKRKPEDALDDPVSIKRARVDIDILSNLSQELILRVLAFLSPSDLAVCHRLSRLFHRLAADSQLWKALYYNRFVRPRASRIPGLRDSVDDPSSCSKWLDEGHLVRHGAATKWKRRYKLRHNWSQGSCAVSEIPVAEAVSVPPILLQMHRSTIFMADAKDGLRAWNNKTTPSLIAHVNFSDLPSPPTALAVHGPPSDTSGSIHVAVGFQNGSFGIWELDAASFHNLHIHPASSNGMLSAIAISWPHLTTMTANQLLSLYQFNPDRLDSPLLLHSLRSHTVWPPLTLAFHPCPDDSIRISIAYALPTYLSGWTVGIQEMRIDPKSSMLLSSRLASAIASSYAQPPFRSTQHKTPTSAPSSHNDYDPSAEATGIHSHPTSLSYTHPYLLVSHPDNTLTLYLVSSTSESLSISRGHRLWGHTSSVSGAHVGGRGKAVSVSKRGDELRVWELEGGWSSQRRSQAGLTESVRIRPETSNVDDETTMSRGWVGFDDENVVVLKERGTGGQALVVYDFA